MCTTRRNGENVITGIKVSNSYVTSIFLRGKMLTFMGTNSMEICIKIIAPVSTKRPALKGRPIAFASKSLTDTKTRYANIERKMPAVIYACENSTFVYGKPFKVLSYHKPLEMIHLKNLGAAPPRLQRMLLRLQGYDVVKPGRKMLLSDAMSRLNPLPGKTIETPVRIDHVMFSELKIQQNAECNCPRC